MAAYHEEILDKARDIVTAFIGQVRLGCSTCVFLLITRVRERCTC